MEYNNNCLELHLIRLCSILLYAVTFCAYQSLHSDPSVLIARKIVQPQAADETVADLLNNGLNKHQELFDSADQNHAQICSCQLLFIKFSFP
jgi:hypothetical protein